MSSMQKNQQASTTTTTTTTTLGVVTTNHQKQKTAAIIFRLIVVVLLICNVGFNIYHSFLSGIEEGGDDDDDGGRRRREQQQQQDIDINSGSGGSGDNNIIISKNSNNVVVTDCGNIPTTTTTTITSATHYSHYYYQVPIITTQIVYLKNQSYEMLVEELPTDLRKRYHHVKTENHYHDQKNQEDDDDASTSAEVIQIQNFTWSQLKKQVAFIILVTSCEGIYQHLSLSEEYVTVFFVSSIDDGLSKMPCNDAIDPIQQHIIVNQTVNYENNGLKVMAGYKAAKAAGYSIIFKMDSDCILNLPTLKKILNFVASQQSKTYYIGEMMMNGQFMSGMLYGFSDYNQKLPIDPPNLVPHEDNTFGQWINSMHNNALSSQNQIDLTRLNLAPWYYGKNKRLLKKGCDWLIVHNSAWDSHNANLHNDYDCLELQKHGQYNGTLKDFVTLMTRIDHRRIIIDRNNPDFLEDNKQNSKKKGWKKGWKKKKKKTKKEK